jgi:hypothetical protein
MNDEVYDKLNSELEQVYSEVRALRINQHVFWEVQELIRNNPDLKKPSTFYSWMGEMYAAAMSVAVRRLVDKRKDSVSFVRLLEQLKEMPQCVSREAYKGRFFKPSMPPDFLDRDYDRLIGAGIPSPNPTTIDDEIQKLKQKTAALKKFVDKKVAHTSLEPLKELPKFQDVDDAIDMLEALTKWYLHLFRSVSTTKLLPTWQYDWKEIFRFPWIVEQEKS